VTTIPFLRARAITVENTSDYRRRARRVLESELISARSTGADWPARSRPGTVLARARKPTHTHTHTHTHTGERRARAHHRVYAISLPLVTELDDAYHRRRSPFHPVRVSPEWLHSIKRLLYLNFGTSYLLLINNKTERI